MGDKFQKQRGAAAMEPIPRKAIPAVSGPSDDDQRRSYARVVVAPEVATYRVVNAAETKSGLGERLDTPALLECLRDLAAAANRGDLSHVEAMLMNQATALQTLYVRLVERGMGCEDIPAFEINMRMGLRAQAQCRATLETLANIKNPPTVFARQANIANGPQQVNNAAPESRAGKSESPQTQLLEAQHGERLDTGAAGAAIGADPHLATMGAIDGAEVGRG